jgi:hypothetical protein
MISRGQEGAEGVPMVLGTTGLEFLFSQGLLWINQARNFRTSERGNEKKLHRPVGSLEYANVTGEATELRLKIL